ncbi:MAG: GNAT family N-acetyltransferase [Trueperaceae bacterium]|nr:MAG: GNAT family N-acetyltransferase [Trueperaceae bacterium]
MNAHSSTAKNEKESRFWIRPYRDADFEAVYHVCLKTGDSGEDGTHLYDDPLILGHVYVGPYVTLEPELAFVLEDELGVCGYVLGALDSETFWKAYLEEWLPRIRESCPDPAGDPAMWTPTEKLYHFVHHPTVEAPPEVSGYPAHLHIDLLPRAQGQGNGTKMMQTLLDKLKEMGSPAVYLGMSSVNHRAYRFYTKLGFKELCRVGSGEPHTVYLGLKLS